MRKIYDKYGFRFREWNIYKDTRQFRKEIYLLLEKFPKEEKYALTTQTKRALNSILLNIAEGANKNTNKEMKLYISRAATSLDEAVACLDCALDNRYITEKEHQEALQKAESLARRLKGFSIKLSNN